MAGRFLLDTNAVIYMLAGDAGIGRGQDDAEKTFLAVTSVGELYFGAAKSGRPELNRTTIDRLLGEKEVLPCDSAVAREYGRLKAVLRRQGTPIPDNDIWIAAIALRKEMTLVSRDRHFERIPELRLVAWR
ncbi:MAG: type II toxin-antitoxin system VapC family toxin [Acidobacteria bacterium]|nr:type II toxin-antitoxin system VapC family toxin [Acidobacteriota bacterium]